jgi:hypothetical protein
VAVATVLVSVAAAWTLLGTATWDAFFASTERTTHNFYGSEGRYDMFASLYGLERYAGIAVVPAILAQMVLGLAILGVTIAAWRSPRLNPDIKAALFLGCWLGHVRRQPAPA